ELNLHGITVKKDWEKDFQVNGEEHHLKQVFINLLKNAIESMDEPGEIQILMKPEDESMLSITFTDSGNGIAADDLSEVFQPFYTTKASGTGLGLLISQKIVQEHQGDLLISSTLGVGTAATILLPTD